MMAAGPPMEALISWWTVHPFPHCVGFTTKSNVESGECFVHSTQHLKIQTIGRIIIADQAWHFRALDDRRWPQNLST